MPPIASKKEVHPVREFVPAEIGLIYVNNAGMAGIPKIRDSGDAYKLLLMSWNQGLLQLQEEMALLLLDESNHVLGIYKAFTGSTNAIAVSVKLIYAAAIIKNAASIILAHNHPSGNLAPSASDIMLTRRVFKAGLLLGINLRDHIILSSAGYSSMMNKKNLKIWKSKKDQCLRTIMQQLAS